MKRKMGLGFREMKRKWGRLYKHEEKYGEKYLKAKIKGNRINTDIFYNKNLIISFI